MVPRSALRGGIPPSNGGRSQRHQVRDSALYFHGSPAEHLPSRPANILLTNKNVPVLVDYGFAEKNDPEDETSFHSSLAYGTPEVEASFS
jgi:hypothetical protein